MLHVLCILTNSLLLQGVRSDVTVVSGFVPHVAFVVTNALRSCSAQLRQPLDVLLDAWFSSIVCVRDDVASFPLQDPDIQFAVAESLYSRDVACVCLPLNGDASSTALLDDVLSAIAKVSARRLWYHGTAAERIESIVSGLCANDGRGDFGGTCYEDWSSVYVDDSPHAALNAAVSGFTDRSQCPAILVYEEPPEIADMVGVELQCADQRWANYVYSSHNGGGQLADRVTMAQHYRHVREVLSIAGPLDFVVGPAASSCQWPPLENVMQSPGFRQMALKSQRALQAFDRCLRAVMFFAVLHRHRPT